MEWVALDIVGMEANGIDWHDTEIEAYVSASGLSVTGRTSSPQAYMYSGLLYNTG
jgi:lambda repressor-like predicted transcriptional regulator